MVIRDDFLEFTNERGMVTPRKGQSSNNDILYTSIKYILYYRLGVLIPDDRKEFETIIRNLQVEPGLLNRHPPNAPHKDQEGPDDYVGAIAAAFLNCSPIAKEIYDYGSKRTTKFDGFFSSERTSLLWLWNLLDALFGWINVRFNYNNVNPGKMHRSSWLGRQPQLIAHMEFANRLEDVRPPLWRKLWWAVVVATAGMSDKKDTDARILSWILIQTRDKSSAICGIAKDIWTYRLRRDYAGGMRDVFKASFGEDHPIAKYSPFI